MHKATLKKLLRSQGKTEEDLKDKSNEELEAMLEGDNLEEVLDNLEDVEEVKTEVAETNEPPDYLSPEWSVYVMTKFSPEELTDNSPNVHGLRRVAQVLLGDIISSKVISLFPATDTNSYGRASCIHEIVFKWHDGSIRTFQDVAGSYAGNTDQEYAKYPEAIAATRAETRCLRKALRIQGPSAEEVCKVPASRDIQLEIPISDNISANQISMIKNRSQTYNISVDKLIKKVIGEESKLENLKREQATAICTFLNCIQTNREDISEDLKEI